jgi:hypothetical protein
MGTVSLTDPVSGTTSDATMIANNNTALESCLNGGIDAANFAAGKILAPSKLTQEAAATNQLLAWNGTSWVPFSTPHGRASKNTTQVVNNNTNTAIIFTTEDTDVGGLVDISGQPTRLTFAVAGYYSVGGYAAILNPSDATWETALRIRLNGTTFIGGNLYDRIDTGSSSDREMNVAVERQFAAADYVELIIFHTGTGTTQTVQHTNDRNPKFWARFIAP